MTLTFADITTGVRLTGRWPRPVTVVAVTPHGDSALAIVVRDDETGIAEEMLYESELADLTIAADSAGWTFDSDAGRFKLATEALRIRMAGAHDPMVAVATSDISPLPHQIRAVYGELLPRTPLRFLLADDPGAGKTIMAGLYAKELMLRGDLARMLVVAPGGLVEQWQEELETKFGITATLLTRDMIEASVDGDPFSGHPVMIARMDQLARNEDLLEALSHTDWDLVVVDEAHRMSANWWGGELRMTRRFELGQLLGSISRHLLLMTATPHSGSDDNFAAFLSLLDEDRFAGHQLPGAPTPDTSGLMRRMVKEELLTFEGKPLFPERIAETVPYDLSDGELELYEAVTHYVREEMNRAEAQADSPQRRTVGFALTVLQRRLASSTHAILRSLERRRHRLAAMRAELQAGRNPFADPAPQDLDALDDSDDFDAAEYEAAADEVVDAATAARTVAELDVEIALLDDLVAMATRVRDSGVDRKWSEVRDLLIDRKLLRGPDGQPRKLIIFTEHRDTLDYLARQIRNVLGSDEAVLTIHGGTPRRERTVLREQFTNDPRRQVLVATDAAGEGLNLQAANLMINYDLPWNPNRLEQRFGRIHRIGQKQVCRLWNVVADQTREGQVYLRLLEKMEQQRKAYGGKLFDVLGESFTEQPLRKLLMDAIRYGDDPKRLEEIERVVDATVADGCRDLVQSRALARETLGPLELEQLRREMDEAQARRLQPHYIERFFREAFGALGGRLAKREKGLFQIANVPLVLRDRPARREHGGRPVVRAYERVAFEPAAAEGVRHRVDLLAPGHPLLDAVVDATVERGFDELRRGAVLVDPADPGDQPRVIVAMTGEIVDGTGRVVSKRFSFVDLRPDGTASDAGPAPHLDLAPIDACADPVAARRAADRALATEWLSGQLADAAMGWAAGTAQPQHLAEVRTRLVAEIDRTADAVRSRLHGQINHLHGEVARLREEDAAGGRRRKRRHSPDTLAARAEDLELRLERRLAKLQRQRALTARRPELAAVMVVIPAGMLGGAVAQYARDTTLSERRAVDLALASERALGRSPEEMAHNNKGFDIRSTTPGTADPTVFLEVKGRVEGADSVFVSYNEVLHALNTGQQHRLVLVSVSPDGPEHDEIRYLTDYFSDVHLGDADVAGVQLQWKKVWAKGLPPH
ncbi:helicase-related protein [Gordonia crocea]|uniref:Helicase n=1 Tax=Gordonia crocea TaxID=589162 RepID=A0A7I9UVK9_9ACTN|nr:helicase-related protein [Gordonia crocea]GED97175.1 helicase [Gordonia crocea]